MDQHRFSPVADSDTLLALLNEAGPIPSKPTNITVRFPSLELFFKRLNKACRLFQKNCFRDEELLVAEDTTCKKSTHHTTTTDCCPDITLAFKSRWGMSFSWPWAELVGANASADRVDPFLKAASYVHRWLLARPDRTAALSFITSKRGVTFLVAIEGSATTRALFLPWGSDSITEVVFAFLYRLYRPGNWADSSFTRKVTEHDVTFDIKVKGTTYEDFKPLFASNPFVTRTHVLFNLNNPSVKVITSQLSRKSRRFVEREIYQHIRRDGDVPGIPHVLFFFDSVDFFNPARTHHIIGLKEYGRPIMMAATLLDTLEILYDVLEVIRYLYVRHGVLHRDISNSNILFLAESVVPPGPIPTDHEGLCFIRHLLDSAKFPHPHETRAMLIDFNNSEILGEKTDTEDPEGKKRTGTPGFVARAVDKNGPVPFSDRVVIPKIPAVPDVYKAKLQPRVDRFPPSASHALPQEQTAKPWRHDLEHDAESVFWVMFYWLIAAHPEGKQPEPIPLFAWYAFTGNWKARDKFIATEVDADPFHSFFEPVAVLMDGVASVVAPDRSWLSEQDPRNHPEYALEGFQRLILSFVLQNKDKDFMRHSVDLTLSHRLDVGSQFLSSLCTPAFMSFSEGLEDHPLKRKNEPRDEGTSISKKARCATVNATAEATPNHGQNAEDDEDDEDDDVEDISARARAHVGGWEELSFGQEFVLRLNYNMECVRKVYR
ncbi:hypothetical protein ONZ45_g3308 [Pleurotus djamor]|nr:hypothetical protein ONZ45_g3308 [Pleurotus djamor]